MKECFKMEADGDRSTMQARTLEAEEPSVEHGVSVAIGKGEEA